jgi:hypothetical protein
MDAALDTPPRTSVVLRAYAGTPLTLKDAEIMRQSISKIRTRIRDRNKSLVSQYDALVIRAVPELEACTLTLTFASEDEEADPDFTAPATPARPTPPSQLAGLSQYQRGVPCYLTLRRTDGFTFTIGTAQAPAPSFTEAWRTIRPFLPGKLVLTNAYTLEQGVDYQVEGSAPSAPGRSVLDESEESDGQSWTGLA